MKTCEELDLLTCNALPNCSGDRNPSCLLRDVLGAVALRVAGGGLKLVHLFVLNGKHTDTGIEPGTSIFDLTTPAPLHQWCVPVKKGVHYADALLLPSTVISGRAGTLVGRRS